MSELPKKSADGIVYAEFERLARIEAAAREVLTAYEYDRTYIEQEIDELRKALGDGGGK